jgi:hypothetical protein
LRGDLNPAKQVDLAQLLDSHLLHHFVPLFDSQHQARFAHGQSLRVQVERAEIVAGRHQSPHRRITVAGGFTLRTTEPSFVGQTDGHERAARAFGAVFQWLRDGTGGGRERLLDRTLSEGQERVVHRDSDALFGRSVINDPLAAVVAVFPQHKRLRGELDSIGIPGFQSSINRFAGPSAFVIDGRHMAVTGFDQVHFGDDAVGIAGEFDRAGLAGGAILNQLGGWWQIVLGLVDFRVANGALDSLDVMRELRLDPFVIEQSRTIHELVEHSGR